MKKFEHQFPDGSFYYEYLSSTMDKAEELIQSGRAEGNFIVIAGKQRQGRGRKGNFWYSPEGGLWFTLALYGFEFTGSLTIMLGICMHQALIKEYPDLKRKELQLKWPNDIFLQKKKLGGLIVKKYSVAGYYLCGFGINTHFSGFPENLTGKAVSLMDAEIKKINNHKILKGFLDKLMTGLPMYIENGRIDRRYFYCNDYLYNMNITIRTEFSSFTGHYEGISKEGALLLRLSSGSVQPFYAGEISIDQ